MSNSVLPNLKGLSWGVIRTPRFSSQVQTSVALRQTSCSFTPYPVFDYQLQFELLRTQPTFLELQQLEGFFMSRQGQYDTFLIDDTDDDLATDQACNPATGDGTNRVFQLLRVLGSFAAPVYEIKTSSPVPVVKVDGVTVSSANYSINAVQSGVLTFGVGHAPAAGKSVTASFGYYWRCRFADDKMDFEKFMSYRYRVDKVSLTGQRP